MSEYELHPEDTEQNHLDLATKAVASAKPANRIFVFSMRDRIEIAFAQVRALQGYTDETERSFVANYHTGISLDLHTAQTLHSHLSVLLEDYKSEEEQEASSDG